MGYSGVVGPVGHGRNGKKWDRHRLGKWVVVISAFPDKPVWSFLSH
jgi:hypothetical protein